MSLDLDLNIAKLAGPGRRSIPIEFSYERDLNETDLQLLQTQDRGSQAPEIKRITDRHHALARLLAAGVSDGEAAFIVGYTASRVSILKSSTAFRELLEVYKAEARREFSTTIEHMAGLARDAFLELRERVEETPEKISNRELLDIGTGLVDRTVSAGGDEEAPIRIELVAPADPLALPPPVEEGEEVSVDGANSVTA